MAFLDNSGDIILDAVLTDTGRARLARGDGSFKIAKFAFGDDEIDYASYNASHDSGSAYFDLEILQTPIFEAFTNNTATMNSKLLSLTNNNLLYLPILKLNTKYSLCKPTTEFGDSGAIPSYGSGSHVVATTSDTIDKVDGSTIGDPAETLKSQGVINGVSPSTDSNYIRVDQGLDTQDISAALTLDPELKETQYIIEMDSRFGSLWDIKGSAASSYDPSFIDDDLIASYYVTLGNGLFVADSVPGNVAAGGGGGGDPEAKAANESIDGPRGTRLIFSILASTDLSTSNYLFTALGGTLQDTLYNYYYIDSTIRVTGITTGYKIDIPVRYLKYYSDI